MKRNQIVLLAALIIFSVVIGACTRSATGNPTEAKSADTTLPNPVSTQSQLMKDIIAGTQTAMAVPVGATLAAGTQVSTDNGDEAATTETTPEPIAVEPTAKPLPTSTAGPAPVVVLEYNAKKCAPGLYLCVVEYKKDQTVTIQGSYPWLLNDMDLTFKMGPDGVYDYSKYIVVGTSNYKPDASKGYGFRVTLNIPDGMRGAATIVVRLETNDSNYYGSDYFANK
jgi:hypothetical protein